MLGVVLLVVWFLGVCLHLVHQQYSGELSGRDVSTR